MSFFTRKFSIVFELLIPEHYIIPFQLSQHEVFETNVTIRPRSEILHFCQEQFGHFSKLKPVQRIQQKALKHLQIMEVNAKTQTERFVAF